MNREQRIQAILHNGVNPMIPGKVYAFTREVAEAWIDQKEKEENYLMWGKPVINESNQTIQDSE